MVPAYPREEMMRRVCEAVEAGATLDGLAARAGWPSRQTVFRWAREDAAFAQRLGRARDWRRGAKVSAQAGPVFDAGQAEALLLAVRRGTAIRDLVRTPGWPNRDRLNRWKAERPDFAAALAAAVRFAAEVGGGRRKAYDAAAADQIIVRVSRGEPLPQVLAEPGMPCRPVLRRWRRQRPDLDRAIRAASLAGLRNRLGGGRRARMAAVGERVVEMMSAGASLLQASKAPGMPHYVTLMAWQRRDTDFAAQLAWARELGLEALGAEAVEIADRCGPDMAWLAQRRIGAIRKQVGRMASKNRKAEGDDG